MPTKYNVPSIHKSLRGRFSPTTVVVLWNLLSHMKVSSKAPKCNTTLSILAKDTRLSKPTIIHSIKELKAEGIITVERGGVNKTTGRPILGNTYKLVLSWFPEYENGK